MPRTSTLHGAAMLAAALVHCSIAAAQTSSIPVSANITAQGGSVEIGTIEVDDSGASIQASLTLNDDYAFLLDWYDFRWLNIVTSINGDTGATWGVVGDFPAVDPAPGDGVGGNADPDEIPDELEFYPDNAFNDGKPWYYTDDEQEGQNPTRPFVDARASGVNAGRVIGFTTYLCIESKTDPSIDSSTVCILGGFTWTSTIPAEGGQGVVEQTTSITDPGNSDAELANNAFNGSPTVEGVNFNGFSASVDCALSACPTVVDCVYSSIPGVTFSESIWTLDGEAIGKTFEGGVTPPPGVPLYDETPLPAVPNDWHWSVNIPVEFGRVTLQFDFEQIPAGTNIEVELFVTNDQTIDQTLLVDVGIENDLVEIVGLKNGEVYFAGAWSEYPGNLPPGLFQTIDAARANFLDEPVFPCPCAGDINGDCIVNALDLGLLLNNFGCVGADCVADLNDDGIVNAADLGLLLNDFGCVGKVKSIPDENRGIEAIEFMPGSAPGLWNVMATWYVETNETDSFKDLSAEVAVSVNGQLVGAAVEIATINAAGGACLGSTPPCSQQDCGTWSIGILTLNGTCVKSIASVVGIDFCTCACVVFTVALEDYPLLPGDTVTVELIPIPGSLPETITGDDSLTTTFTPAAGTGACCLDPFGSGCIDGVTAEVCAGFEGATFFPGQTCAGVGCGPAISPCCSALQQPGCADPACEAAVCGIDPFCCDVQWDQLCADLATKFPSCGCSATSTGACCLEPFGSGCFDDVTAQFCADIPGATWFGGSTCAGVGCAPAISPCCEAQGQPGCEDPECESIVCAQDPFCCDASWDKLCANLANEVCPVCIANQILTIDFKYANGPQFIIPDTADFPLPGFEFRLPPDAIAPVIIIPMDKNGDPVDNHPGYELVPGASIAITIPSSIAYLMVPTPIPGATSTIEIENYLFATTSDDNRACSTIEKHSVIVHDHKDGTASVTIAAGFTVPADDDSCYIDVTAVVQRWDTSVDPPAWVDADPAEQPSAWSSPQRIHPGQSKDISVTVKPGYKVEFFIQCPGFGKRCKFTKTNRFINSHGAADAPVKVKPFDGECGQMFETISIEHITPPGGPTIRVGVSFKVPADDGTTICTLEVKRVIQFFDEDLIPPQWVDLESETKVINPGQSWDGSKTIPPGRRIQYHTHCQSSGGPNECSFTYTSSPIPN